MQYKVRLKVYKLYIKLKLNKISINNEQFFTKITQIKN